MYLTQNTPAPPVFVYSWPSVVQT